jgi:hypothetical protein
MTKLGLVRLVEEVADSASWSGLGFLMRSGSRILRGGEALDWLECAEFGWRGDMGSG